MSLVRLHDLCCVLWRCLNGITGSHKLIRADMACRRDHVRHVDVARAVAHPDRHAKPFHKSPEAVCSSGVLVVMDVRFTAREPRIWHVLCVPIIPKRRYVPLAAKSFAPQMGALPGVLPSWSCREAFYGFPHAHYCPVSASITYVWTVSQ